MKTFKILFTILLLSSLNLWAAPSCSEAPTTETITSETITNSDGSQEIAALKGEDCSGDAVESFKIFTLPDPSTGVLYIDGETAVTKNQVLTKDEAECLTFTPADGFTGNASFTYGAIDSTGYVDLAGATMTIPVVAGTGGDCTEAPTTDNLENPSLLNTLGAVNILDLSGEDCSGTEIESFQITKLPDANAGVLYMADGVTAVTEGQVLTAEQADGLKFDPAPDFVGDATFTYVSIDEDGVKDASVATVTIPVITEDGGSCTEAPTTDSLDNPTLLNTLGAVNILNLSGRDCSGTEVGSFQIVTLPNAHAGVLYMADGVTAVVAGQTLTIAEADALRFDPIEGFVGDASFTYVAIDENGNMDASPATVTIPLENQGTCTGNNAGADADAGTGAGTDGCTCKDYETGVPSLSTGSLIALSLLISAIGFFFTRREKLNKDL